MVTNKVHNFQNPTATMSPFSLKDTRDLYFAAVEQMLERGATYREAAANHSVPVATLHDRGTRDKSATRNPSRLASLSAIEEDVLVLCCVGMPSDVFRCNVHNSINPSG